MLQKAAKRNRAQSYKCDSFAVFQLADLTSNLEGRIKKLDVIGFRQRTKIT